MKSTSQTSFLDIYNEEIRDLLVNDSLKHDIKMNESKEVIVTNLKVEEVYCQILIRST